MNLDKLEVNYTEVEKPISRGYTHHSFSHATVMGYYIHRDRGYGSNCREFKIAGENHKGENHNMALISKGRPHFIDKEGLLNCGGGHTIHVCAHTAIYESRTLNNLY